MLMVMVLMMMVTIILEQVQWTFQEEGMLWGSTFRFLPSNTVSNFHCKYPANKLNTGTIKTEIALTPGLLMTMILI
jgi:hypothetical protein